jgi:hypothetical protein
MRRFFELDDSADAKYEDLVLSFGARESLLEALNEDPAIRRAVIDGSAAEVKVHLHVWFAYDMKLAKRILEEGPKS